MSWSTSISWFYIKKALSFYKFASSFNDQYAKNNIGVIYKVGETIDKNIVNAIVYFNEAIQQNNDVLSIYNLANIYFFDENEKDFQKSISLLSTPIEDHFPPLYDLLCLIIVKKYGKVTKKIVENELNNNKNLADEIFKNIKIKKLENKKYYDLLYESHKKTTYLYSTDVVDCYSKEPHKKFNKKRNFGVNINESFYEGFGHDLL